MVMRMIFASILIAYLNIFAILTGGLESYDRSYQKKKYLQSWTAPKTENVDILDDLLLWQSTGGK